MKKIMLAVFLFSFCKIKAQSNTLIIGTYTSGKSDGIYLYKFNSKNGESEKLSSIKSSNPSYVAIGPKNKFVYTVNEDGNNNGVSGSVSSFFYSKDSAKLILLNKVPSGGDHPCYVALDKTEKWLAVGNYNGGNIAILPINDSGKIGEAKITQHFGNSVHPRQTKPHVHCTYFSDDNKFLLVPDLGLDKTMMYKFDEISGIIKLTKKKFLKSDTASGPRHITISPNNKNAYIIEELSAIINVCTYKKGKLISIQKIKADPYTNEGSQGSADIHISSDGKFLYCSNRAASNTISVYSINKLGLLTLIQNTSSLGIAPRNFNFDPSEKFLLVANQKSDNIVVFRRDNISGIISDSGKRIEVPNPVCIKWIE